MVTSCVVVKTLNCLMMVANVHDTIIKATNEKIMVILVYYINRC